MFELRRRLVQDERKCGWRNHKQMKIGGTACKWAGITDVIDEAAKRLRGDTTHLVQIERMDALRLMDRYNNRDVLMYVDLHMLERPENPGDYTGMRMGRCTAGRASADIVGDQGESGVVGL